MIKIQERSYLKLILQTITSLLICIATNAQSPGNVGSDLEIWFKADRGVIGTSPVTEWINQTGNTANAIQGAQAPDLLPNEINFNPAISFLDPNDYLQINGGMLGSETIRDVTIYSVSKSDITNVRTILREEGVADRRLAVLLGNTSWIFLGSNNYSATSNINNIDYNIWAHMSSENLNSTSGVNKSIARDGEFLGTGSLGSTLITGNNSDMLIGGGWDDGNGASGNFQGRLAELILYKGIPNPIEQEQIQTYLAIKYGITKKSDDNLTTFGTDEADYIASDGITVIWDYSQNALYHNNVTGIGRDDNSELNQTISKSSSTKSYVTIDKGGAFPNDRDYIIWGTNDQYETTDDVPVGYEVRSNRVWKVAVTGTPGAVNVSVDLTGLGFDAANNSAPEFALLIDDDGVFAPNTSIHTTGANLSGGVISFSNVNFSDGDYFSIAGPRLSSPGNVSKDLELWFKADQGVTGSSPVSSWTNQAGGTVDAIQIANAPDLMSDAVNFNPVVDFNSINSEYLQINTGFLGNRILDDIIIYSVYKADVTSFGTLVNEVAENGSLSLLSHLTTRFFLGLSSIGAPPFGTIDDFHIMAHASSNTNSTPSGTFKSIARDGFYVGAGGSRSLVIGNGSNLIIGGGSTNGTPSSQNFDGKLAELILYSGSPTPFEQEQIQTYLAIKYGITKKSVDNTSTIGIDEADYFSSDGNVIWDHSNESTYHNNIIGIGRDDLSGLTQKQSKTDSLIIYIETLANTNSDNTGFISNDKSYILIGDNQGQLKSTIASKDERPAGIFSKFEREWKITNSNFSDNFSLVIKWDSIGNFDINNIRLLVDSDGDFSNAIVYGTESGLSFDAFNSSIIISGIDSPHIPLNEIRFITVGSIDSSTPLPIELVEFKAEPTDAKVKLSWITASEVNNNYFNVEKSKDLKNWKSILQVQGTNTQNLTFYSETDETPWDGISYYRLKQTDYDGQFSHSEIERVEFSNSKRSITNPFPNPVSQRLNIIGKKYASTKYRIFNSLGQELSQLTKVIKQDNEELIIDFRSLQTGLYFIHLDDEIFSILKK